MDIDVAGEGISIPANAKSAFAGNPGLRSTIFFNTRPFKAGCLRFGGCDPLPMLSVFHPSQRKSGRCPGPRHGVKWGRLGSNGVETGGRGWVAKPATSGDATPARAKTARARDPGDRKPSSRRRLRG
jgi:hypothetical protein